MKFNTVEDKRFGLLNPDICQYHDKNELFNITETNPEGLAKIAINLNAPCFHIANMDKRAFQVLKTKKCADHLVFVFDKQLKQWDLHIFELKKSISASKWETEIIPQFDGALINAYAISGVLHIDEFKSITIHCGFRINKSLTSTVERKSPLGKRSSDSWLNSIIELPSFPDKRIDNDLIQLDEKTGSGKYSE